MDQLVALGRLAYMETNYASGYRGLYRLMQKKPLYYRLRLMPQAWFDYIAAPVLKRVYTGDLMVRLLYGGAAVEDQRSCSGWASLAKVAGAGLGFKN
jgi:hypothetical protein